MKTNETPKFSRVFDILSYQNTKFPQKKALNKIVDGRWKAYSIDDIIIRVDALSCHLTSLSYKKGDRIAVIPEIGRPEWLIFDFACQQIGLILVPIHPTASEKEIDYILNETEVKFCLTADSGLFFKVKSIIDEKKYDIELKHLELQAPNYFDNIKVNKAGKEQLAILEEIKSSIKEEDTLAIMYTSGTSGIPKGVILSHKNFVSNITSILAVFPLEHSTKVLSFLPFAHILERIAAYSYIAMGVNIYFSHDRESFLQDFKTVKPEFCTMVPRILEKMYDFVHIQLTEKNPVKRLVIRRAFNLAKKYKSSIHQSFLYKFRLFIARIFVLYRWRKILGGKIKYMAVGAAALRPEIGRFFSAAKIRIREGYGMTETSPLISLNRFNPGMNRFGTVGIPIPGVEVKINVNPGEEDGEILVKGPNVMKAYYKQADLTKEAFTPDGWFKTGDVGKFVDQKFLQITDRKKDIFKTSTGKYIAPQVLENHIISSPYIQQCLIIGFKRPFVSALIVPHFSLLENWCNHNSIHWTSPQFMVHNIRVREFIQKEIDRFNEELPNYRRIKNFFLCHDEWTVETEELTSSYKPIRDVLLNKFNMDIDKMYE